MKQNSFQIGDTVVVKAGVKDPDLDGDIGGWQGRIEAFYPEVGTALIRWDSVTLKAVPREIIRACEKDGLDWQVMGLDLNDLQPAASRDVAGDLDATLGEMDRHSHWLHLDDENEEGQRIQAVLDGIDPDDEPALVTAWNAHLEKVLRFPFEAEVAEFHERSPLRDGDRVTVKGILDTDEHRGVIVNVTRKGTGYAFPLCDLEAIDRESPNYQPLRDYVIWFANL
jgi:hypothetical protein